MNIKKMTIIILIFILVLIFNWNNISFASSENVEVQGIDEIISSADKFLEYGDANSVLNTTSIKPITDNLYNILFSIGMVIAVIVGLVLGIQFMLAASEEKAKIKETLIPYIVGCVIVFGAFGIWKIVLIVLQTID